MTKEKRERRPRKPKTLESETKTETSLETNASEAVAVNGDLSESPVPTELILENKAANSSESFSEEPLAADNPELDKKTERVYYNFDNIEIGRAHV